MFWTINKSFLAACLIILDVLLLIDIQNNKNSSVVTIEKPRTIQVVQVNPAQIGSAKTTESPTLAPTSAPQPPANTTAPVQNNSGGLLEEVNNYRASKGLGAVNAEQYTCAFANTRASEITSVFNHDGFSSRVNSKTLPYPSFSEIAENIAMNSNPAEIVTGWINSPGHNENLLKNTPYACIGNSGEYYAYESWRP